MEAKFELLTTKDNSNNLQFHKDDYFMNKKGELKRKYYDALSLLQKENVIKLTANFNAKNDKWDFDWEVIFKG